MREIGIISFSSLSTATALCSPPVLCTRSRLGPIPGIGISKSQLFSWFWEESPWNRNHILGNRTNYRVGLIPLKELQGVGYLMIQLQESPQSWNRILRNRTKPILLFHCSALRVSLEFIENITCTFLAQEELQFINVLTIQTLNVVNWFSFTQILVSFTRNLAIIRPQLGGLSKPKKKLESPFIARWIRHQVAYQPSGRFSHPAWADHLVWKG